MRLNKKVVKHLISILYLSRNKKLDARRWPRGISAEQSLRKREKSQHNRKKSSETSIEGISRPLTITRNLFLKVNSKPRKGSGWTQWQYINCISNWRNKDTNPRSQSRPRTSSTSIKPSGEPARSPAQCSISRPKPKTKKPTTTLKRTPSPRKTFKTIGSNNSSRKTSRKKKKINIMMQR